jgi:hypothetical protein
MDFAKYCTDNIVAFSSKIKEHQNINFKNNESFMIIIIIKHKFQEQENLYDHHHRTSITRTRRVHHPHH